MLALYHQQDGVEKRICVTKNGLNVSPVYLHKDERIEAMLLINMLALLVYSTLERQARRGGLQMTSARIIEKLESLDFVETYCVDGSRLLRLVPVDAEQAAIVEILVRVLRASQQPSGVPLSLPVPGRLLWSLPPPVTDKAAMQARASGMDELCPRDETRRIAASSSCPARLSCDSLTL